MPVTEALDRLALLLPVGCQTADASSSPCLSIIENSLLDFAQYLGFTCLRYSYWRTSHSNNHSSNHSSKESEEAFSINFSNIPESWDRFYEQKKAYLYDPVVRVIQEDAGKTVAQWGTWADAYARCLDNPLGDTAPEQERYCQQVRKLMEDAGSQGLASGFYFCWGDATRQIILSLASPDADDDIRKRVPGIEKLLHAAVMLVNQSIVYTGGCSACTKNLRVSGGDNIHLTETEARILTTFHSQHNVTIKGVARICDRSVNTVNFHLRSLRLKLKAPGASGHALAAAAKELNLI